MVFPAELLRFEAKKHGVELNDEALRRFGLYARALADYNEKVNLTAITDPEEIAIKHFLDSLLLLPAFSPREGASLVDVGTGAGFPGMALKIARPDLDITLMDAQNKRLEFLRGLSDELGLSVNIVHSRAEDAARKELRERFDFAAARAVAALPVLLEYCIPLLKVGGVFAAMKGPSGEEELIASKNALKLLGGSARVEKALLPGGEGRSIILIEKTAPTSEKYPRPFAKIKSKPL